MKIEDKLTASVIQGVKELYGAEVPAKMVQLQKTKKEFEGHLTLVVFPFLKMSKKGPEQTAQEIGEYLVKNEPAISKYNVIKGFLNLTIASDVWVELLNRIQADEHWGIKKADENSPLVMIEYSSPNTNKPLHLGHVRNNLLGNALANVMAANGNKVVKTNIVNDRGIHICKSMLAWLKYGNGETPESSGKKGDHLIGDYYVAFDKHYKAEVKELMAQYMAEGMSEEDAKAKAEANSPLMLEAREMLRKWEANDPEVRALWKKMNDWVYAGFDETYKMMGVSFDKIYYESNTYLEGKKKVMEGLEKGLFYRKEDGSVWADLTGEGLDHKLLLRAGETKSVNIYLGTEMTEDEIFRSLAACKAPDFFTASMQKLAATWEDFFSGFQCSLPDKDAETMINIWNPYQMERNFRFSRNISYYATGTFRGIGVRDTAQDVLAMIPLQLERAKEKFELLLTQQYQDGHCNHYFFPTEGWEPVTRIHSDNHLWLVMDAYHIALEEGNVSYLDTQAPYFDGGSGTIWEHIKQSIRFTTQNMGAHGFPLMLSSDWNDMLYKVCRKGKGESIWTGMQFAVALRMMQELAERMGEPEFAAECKALYARQQELCRTLAWDGAWFRRCITDEGRFIGSESEPQAKIWLNTQSWAVLSGLGTQEQQRQAMNSVKEYLDTDLGIKKIHPAMTTDYPTKEENLTCYNKGCGENGSVFCHANTWAIIAECMLKRPENAWKYYHQLLPMVAQKTAGAERYKAEPYVYSSNIFGPESDKFGLANVSWLTGTAAWMYLAATQYILGIRPTWDGLEIEPCLPEHLLPAKVTRVFRGCRYEITITKNQKLLLPHVDGRKQLTVTV